VRRILVDGTRFLLAIAVPFIALLFFYADAIVIRWMGQEFADAAPLLRLLLVAVLFSSVQLNAANVLGMTGEHRFVAFAMGGSALLNLILSIILIQTFGLTGVALGTLLATLAAELLLVVPRACRAQGVGVWEFLGNAIWPTLPALVPSVGAAALMAYAQPPDNFGWIILQGSSAALLYYAVFYRTGLSVSERELIVGKVRSGLNRSRAAHASRAE
jgi:O-antigen/teichoic acid export membrane protein